MPDRQAHASRRLRSCGGSCAFASALVALSYCSVALWSVAATEERTPAVSSESYQEKTSNELAKLFDSVVETTDQKFFDETLLKQLDWRTRAQTMRSSVLSAATAEDGIRQINALLSELRTSHTALFTLEDYEYYILLDVLGASPDSRDLVSRRFWGSGPYYPGVGIFTRQIDGRHLVDGILEGSPADRAGLKYGDEVLSVDGMPYSAVAAFRNKIGTTVELEIRRHSTAEPERLQVPVVPIQPTLAFSAATEASARVIERNGARIGYVHIWAVHESSSLQSSLAKLNGRNPSKDAAKPIDSVIVDMRGRVGGNIAIAEQYLDLLQKPYWGHSRVISRSRFQVGVPGAPQFRRHSALLIDHHTRSAAEIMAHGYKRNAFGLVIGTPTAGAVSSGSLFVMPGDLLLYVAIAGHEFEGGQRLEGAGVIPDHRVERPLPYAAGADPVLDTALDLLAKQAH